MTDKVRQCSFCQRSEKELRYIVAGPDVHICESCVLLAVQIIKDAMRQREYQFDDAEKALKKIIIPTD